MVKLHALSPCADLLPLTIGEVTFTEIELPEAGMWSIAPLKGSKPAGLPEIGKSKTTKTSRTLWIGREQYLQIDGKRPTKGAVTDQSDAWAMVSIEGPEALDVLARLCPVDLRSLASGDTVRSLINHMSAIIVATDKGIEVLVFRAFAKTLVHELKEAAEMVAARKGLSD